jgi:hypothetical protein
MIYSVPQRGMNKPRLIATYKQWTYLVFQITGANTLYIAETDTELMIVSDGAQLQDGLQINQAAGIVALWWQGDLWAAGSAPFSFMLQAPGFNTQAPGTTQGAMGANQ